MRDFNAIGVRPVVDEEEQERKRKNRMTNQKRSQVGKRYELKSELMLYKGGRWRWVHAAGKAKWHSTPQHWEEVIHNNYLLYFLIFIFSKMMMKGRAKILATIWESWKTMAGNEESTKGPKTSNSKAITCHFTFSLSLSLGENSFHFLSWGTSHIQRDQISHFPLLMNVAIRMETLFSLTFLDHWFQNLLNWQVH